METYDALVAYLAKERAEERAEEREYALEAPEPKSVEPSELDPEIPF